MRALIIDLIQDTDTGQLTLSQEFPYTADGTALYVKNLRKIYVDVMTTNRVGFIPTLDNNSINTLTNAIRVYWATEAKVSESYEDIVSNLIGIKDATAVRALGYPNRRCSASTEFVDNILVTTLEYEFTKII